MSESFQLQFEPAIGPLTYGLMGTLMRAQREAGRGDQRKNTEIPTKSSTVFQTGSFLGALWPQRPGIWKIWNIQNLALT